MTISFCITPQTFKFNYLSYAAKLGIDIFKKWKWWIQDLCIKKKNKERRNSPDLFCTRNSWNCPKVAFYHLSEFLFLLRVNTMSRDYNGGWILGLGEKAFRRFLDFDGFLRIYVAKFNYIKTRETEYINQNFITSSDIFQNINLYMKKIRVFLVLIFPHSNWIKRDTPFLSVFSPNAGIYGPEKLLIRTFSTRCKLWLKI